jgi:anaerobic magnesium-protoporphyrin IX monomethyl ester cyclase
MTWSCYSRANLDYSTLELMKRSGCRTLHVGYESSSPQILKNICKGVSPETMVRFTRDARKAGLYIVADFITGLPGETVETIKATTAWAIRLPVQRYTITLPKPYPGTPLYEQLAQSGRLKDGRPDYPGLSYEEIRKWNKWSLKRVYLNPRYLLRMLIRPGEWFRLLRSAFFFFPYLLKKQHPYQ